MMNVKPLHLEAFAAAALIIAAGPSWAQPTFGNPSPTAGSSTSQAANAAADQAAYKPVEYANKAKRGPALVVIPGEVKSNNATFVQKFGPNNIADFGELELSQANFQVLERSNLGNLLQEVSLAYNLGDADKARKTMGVGKLKTTKWIVKFDILKAEEIAENKEGFDGRAIGALGGLFGLGGSVAGHVVGSTQTSVMGVSQGAKGGVGLDTMVQRLVQTTVWEIDNKYK